MPSAKEIGKRLLELRGDKAREEVANAAGTGLGRTAAQTGRRRRR